MFFCIDSCVLYIFIANNICVFILEQLIQSEVQAPPDRLVVTLPLATQCHLLRFLRQPRFRRLPAAAVSILIFIFIIFMLLATGTKWMNLSLSVREYIHIESGEAELFMKIDDLYSVSVSIWILSSSKLTDGSMMWCDGRFVDGTGFDVCFKNLKNTHPSSRYKHIGLITLL